MKATYLYGAPTSTAGTPAKPASLSARMRSWHLKRSTIRELNRLSDRDLADIGIERGNIEQIASELTRYR